MKHSFSILLTMCILMVIGAALTTKLDIGSEPRPEQGKTLTIAYWWQGAAAKVVEQNVTFGLRFGRWLRPISCQFG